MPKKSSERIIVPFYNFEPAYLVRFDYCAILKYEPIIMVIFGI